MTLPLPDYNFYLRAFNRRLKGVRGDEKEVLRVKEEEEEDEEIRGIEKKVGVGEKDEGKKCL